MKPVFENIEVNLNSSLKIETYNFEKTCKQLNWHIHPEYEIVYIKNGKGHLQIGTKEVYYDDGLLIFLKGNIPHTNFSNKDYKDNLEVILQFKKKFISDKIGVFPELSNIVKFIKNTNYVLVYNTNFKKQLAKDFECIRNASAPKRLLQTLSILEKMSSSTEFLTIIKENENFKYSTKNSQQLEVIFEYVNLNFKQSIPINNIANHVGLTPNSFCRFFKKMTKKTFIQFLNEIRIAEAIELIKRNTRRYAKRQVTWFKNSGDYTFFEPKNITGILSFIKAKTRKET